MTEVMKGLSFLQIDLYLDINDFRLIIEGNKEEIAMKKSREEIEIRIEMIREGVEAENANGRNVEEVKVLKIGKEIEVIEKEAIEKKAIEKEAIEGVVMTVIED
jgi:hypothetical protein